MPGAARLIAWDTGFVTMDVRLMGDLGGWPLWIEDYDYDGPCGATTPSDWPMLSENLKSELERWNSSRMSAPSRLPSRRHAEHDRQTSEAWRLVRRVQFELGDGYAVRLDL